MTWDYLICPTNSKFHKEGLSTCTIFAVVAMWTVFCRRTASLAGAFANEDVVVGVVSTRLGDLESLIKMQSNNAADKER